MACSLGGNRIVNKSIVSIILPCYFPDGDGGEMLDFTKKCIESIRNNIRVSYDIIIVDNGSDYGVDYLRLESDLYIRNHTNLGYGPAINQGMALSKCHWLVACNNDITFLDDWVHNAIADWGDTTGVVCSHLLTGNEEANTSRAVAGWKHFFGALWMTNKDIVERIGGLDERFEFGMYEDKDWARRITSSGLEIIKSGKCNHVGNATWGKIDNQEEIFYRNKQLFEDKWSK